MADTDRYRVEITRENRWWCEVLIQGGDKAAVLTDLLARFPKEDGFACTVVREREAARLVEVGERTRVLSRRYERLADAADR